MRVELPIVSVSTLALLGASLVPALGVAQEFDSPSSIDSLARGERLAQQHCVACHSFTPPDLLTKRSWNFLLTYMGMRMGIDDPSFIANPDDVERAVIEARRLSLQLGDLIPDSPAMSHEDWKSLRAYFQKSAPETALPQVGKPKSAGVLERFTAKSHAYRVKGAITSMVKIDAIKGQVLIGDSRNQQFTTLNSKLGVVDQIPSQGSYWVDAIATDESLYLLSVGDIAGDFIGQKLGKIAHAQRLGEMHFPQGLVMKDLYRPTDIELADMDKDGRDELLVCSFGDEGGDFSIFRQSGIANAFDPESGQALYRDTGAIRCRTHDFNGDGLLDIVLLVSDANERVSLFINKGNNAYEEKILVAKHPSWGFVDLQLADIDQDGDIDILTANGDNVDSDPYNTLKRYHGVRVYSNNGDLSFSESYFYPMYGCFHVRAGDFDLDGDIDIVASSFYPDFEAETPEQFVYLEQAGPMDFVPKHHPSAQQGRWMTMDAGDFDQDGDMDIVLGAAYVPLGLPAGTDAVLQDQMENGPALLVLENRTIE